MLTHGKLQAQLASAVLRGGMGGKALPELLERYLYPPGRTWLELRSACSRIMPLRRAMNGAAQQSGGSYQNPFSALAFMQRPAHQAHPVKSLRGLYAMLFPDPARFNRPQSSSSPLDGRNCLFIQRLGPHDQGR